MNGYMLSLSVEACWAKASHCFIIYAHNCYDIVILLFMAAWLYNRRGRDGGGLLLATRHALLVSHNNAITGHWRHRYARRRSHWYRSTHATYGSTRRQLIITRRHTQYQWARAWLSWIIEYHWLRLASVTTVNIAATTRWLVRVR